MSSAPSGLDVREYGYSCFRYTIPDNQEHLFDAQRRWLITRIQIFAPATLPAPGNGYLILAGSTQIFFDPGGCVNLEPNGAARGNMIVFGQGSIVLVEFWFQATPDAATPVVTVTP